LCSHGEMRESGGGRDGLWTCYHQTKASLEVRAMLDGVVSEGMS
jgi:hypothetical protein